MLGMFATNEFQVVSLSKWLRALPEDIAMAHTNFSAKDLQAIPFTGTDFR